MLTITRTYTDYNEVERTETFYFNLSPAEVADMQLSTGDGLDKKIQEIIDAHDVPKLTKLFKDLVLKAYGVKSSDGRRFMKSEEISKAFEETPAYSDIYMEFITDAEKAAEFVNELIPDMSKYVPNTEATENSENVGTKEKPVDAPLPSV